jgi:photosystem II stability/assembly factor-like uncharacterized protein
MEDGPRCTHIRRWPRGAWSLALLVGALCGLLIVAPASAAALTSTGDGGWAWQTPLPQGNDLHAVSFADATHGWAVGSCGAILATVDGGATWTAQDTGLIGAHFTDVCFVDTANGWAVGRLTAQNGQPERGVILHTADSGATWALEGPNVPYPEAVTFIDAQHGWVSAVRTVWSTSDGGESWTAHWMGIGSGWSVTDMTFSDVLHGWAVGIRETHQGSWPLAIATSDGGLTWQKQEIPTAENEGARLSSVSFVDASHGWAVGDDTILVTSDGGAHWSVQHTEPGATLGTVTFTDASHGWVVAGRPVGNPIPYELILSTSDGGVTWARQVLDGVLPLSDVSFADGLQGCGVGYNGTIITTGDGGATWQVRSSASPSADRWLEDVAFADGVHGWAVGSIIASDRGFVMSTADGGQSWHTQDLPHPLAAVSFPDQSHGWAAGGGMDGEGIPTVLHTGDGGQSWQVQYTLGSTRGSFHDIDFVDTTHGWVGGSNTAKPYGQPVVAVTSDGGASWKLVTLSHSQGAVNAVSFADAKHGWAVVWWMNANYGRGAGATIYATRNGGLTWQQQFRGSPTFMVNDVCFTDASRGWAVGEALEKNGACAILSTRDSGTTWTPRYLPAEWQEAGQHVMFSDASHGWVASSDEVFATADGGKHWWTERPGCQVAALAFADASHGWLAARDDYEGHANGMLLTTTGGLEPAPFTSVSGADFSWHNRAVRLAFAAVDEPGGAGMAGGQANTEYRVDDGPWVARAALTVPALTDHSSDGIHRVGYRSTDAAGNVEAAKSLTVQIDTTGPAAVARKATGHKGEALRLGYKVTDNLSYTTGSLRIEVRTIYGRLVKTIKRASVPTGIWNVAGWRPRAKGTYRFFVYATDLAGNSQRNVARATVIVK